MSVTGHFQRVVTLRLYTFLLFFITAIFFLYLYDRTQCQNDTLYLSSHRVQPDRHVQVFDTQASSTPSKTKKKTILYWTKMFSSKNFYFGDAKDVFEGCPVSACMGTHDRNYQSVDEFDAVMFHGPEMNDKDLPLVRSPHQRYIFMNSETQIFHLIPNKPVFKNFFNWTMTYRRDSDIMRPYGFFSNVTSGHILPPYIPVQWANISDGPVPNVARQMYGNKTKMVAWFVSHCPTNSRREDVAKKLQQHVQVDVYGNCGPLTCPRATEGECYRKLDSEYFFYLSFENSMCRDYLTEKAYIPMEYNVVPIVYGSADYESFLPPNSYIDVRDFESIEKLAAYLVELSQDEEKYLSYFKWKSFYKVGRNREYIVCEFCRALHQPNTPRQVIGDVYDWWTTQSGCVPPPPIN